MLPTVPSSATVGEKVVSLVVDARGQNSGKQATDKNYPPRPPHAANTHTLSASDTPFSSQEYEFVLLDLQIRLSRFKNSTFSITWRAYVAEAYITFRGAWIVPQSQTPVSRYLFFRCLSLFSLHCKFTNKVSSGLSSSHNSEPYTKGLRVKCLLKQISLLGNPRGWKIYQFHRSK